MQAGSGQAPVWAAIGFITALAGLDLLAMTLAKEWTLHRAPWQLGGSVVAFGALFVVLVAGLRYTELTIITFGWIVLLETGIVLVDWMRYGVQWSPGKWLAMIAILVLQGYLVFGSTTASASDEGPLKPELTADVGVRSHVGRHIGPT